MRFILRRKEADLYQIGMEHGLRDHLIVIWDGSDEKLNKVPGLENFSKQVTPMAVGEERPLPVYFLPTDSWQGVLLQRFGIPDSVMPYKFEVNGIVIEKINEDVFQITCLGRPTFTGNWDEVTDLLH